MLRNYVKIAWRNILKSRFYSSVNIIGLSAGLAFALIIGGYVWNELQVNTRLRNAERQYILQSKWKDPNMGIDFTTLGPLAKALREQYPNLVKNYYRWDGITSNVSKGDKSFREGLQVCDSTMLEMYGFELLYGSPKSAFDGPYSLVITREKAIKYFGRDDVVGQTLSIENFSGSKHDFMITGVLKDQSKNSVTFINDDNNNQFYISSTNISYFGRNMEWFNQYIVSYVELQPGVRAADLDRPMKQLISQNAPPQIAQNLTPYLASLKNYYLTANNGLVQKMIFALSFIALFILLMAVINFVNMAVSRSATRLKEIGIRKVLGGLKKQLMIQFITESVVLVFFSTLFALIIYATTRNLFTDVLGKEIPPLTAFPVYFVFLPAILSLAVGSLAGLYPAFVLSSMKSVDSLKGKLANVRDKIWLRKSLVGFQFGIAAIVFISSIVVSQQINLFFSKDLGFDKDYVVSAQVPRNWTPAGVQKMETMRKEFSRLPQVRDVTVSFEVPDGGGSGNVSLYKPGTDSTAAIPSQILMTDEYYAGTFGIKMVAGEFFSSPGSFTDSSRIVINETQAKALGWNDPRDAIGKQLSMRGSNGFVTKIVGVTKDFHFGSMQTAIPPVTFLHVKLTNTFRLFSFKLKPGSMSSSLAVLQKQWSLLMPGTPFEYRFMDESLARLYRTELQLKKAAYTAAVLAFIIVLLGVIGLVALSVQKRIKEIGIRKVLGSSVAGIIALFIKDFLLVIAIAGIVACPVAYMLMNGWLNEYTYRVAITPVPFVVSIAILAGITALLISLQTRKAALSNPVESLRTE